MFDQSAFCLNFQGEFSISPAGDPAPMKTKTTKSIPSKSTTPKRKLLIKKCHSCGHINESSRELEACGKCNKGFLPLNYFNKIHSQGSLSYKELFSEVEEITEEDLIRGITVLW